MGSSRIAILAAGLTKRFGRGSSLTRLAGRAPRRHEITAVDDVSFRVGDGELVAVAGHNGSGKSTLLRLLATLILPTAGQATVAGHDVVADDVAVRTQLAFVAADDRSFQWRLTGTENLAFFAALHGEPASVVAPALARVGLAEAAGDSYATYSTGMRQRLALARALLGTPSVLLLDEPFRALDTESSDVLRAVLGEAVERGSAVLVATHHPEELGSLASRVLGLSAGRLVHDGPLAGWVRA